LDDFVRILYETMAQTTIDTDINGLDICTQFKASLLSMRMKKPAKLVFKAQRMKENKIAYTLNAKVSDILKYKYAVEF
jgi:hypothetical protein